MEKEIYGVSMTSLEEMNFFKYVSNKGIAMNTISAAQRKGIAQEWVTQNRISGLMEGLEDATFEEHMQPNTRRIN